MTMGSDFMGGGDSRIPRAVRRFYDATITDLSRVRANFLPSKMPALTIRLLGDLFMRDALGRTLSLGSRNTEALAVYLALKVGTSASIREIAAVLYGDSDATGRVEAAVQDLRASLAAIPEPV